jgi:hypothetical protein
MGAVGVVLSLYTPKRQFEEWMWRVPLAIGISGRRPLSSRPPRAGVPVG